MIPEMKNTIIILSNQELVQWKLNIQGEKKIFIGEINGSIIHSSHDYIRYIEDEFKFPKKCYDAWEAYIAFMKNLDWLDEEGYVLIINNFSNMLLYKSDIRGSILLSFLENIIPYWKSLQCDSDKFFTVLLVE
ncbi:MAG: hypothetical protein LKF40_05640 [Megasphaera sp.]|jgi:hypothetical protein|nr:hypothetical protein [Megasphaera sp.]